MLTREKIIEQKKLLEHFEAEGVQLPAYVKEVLASVDVEKLYPNFRIQIDASETADRLMDIDAVEIYRTAEEPDGTTIFDDYSDAVDELKMAVDAIVDNVVTYFSVTKSTKLAELPIDKKSQPVEEDESAAVDDVDDDTADCSHTVGDVKPDQWVGGDEYRLTVVCELCGFESYVDVDMAHVDWEER